jgi:hypothetical protein
MNKKVIFELKMAYYALFTRYGYYTLAFYNKRARSIQCKRIRYKRDKGQISCFGIAVKVDYDKSFEENYSILLETIMQKRPELVM